MWAASSSTDGRDEVLSKEATRKLVNDSIKDVLVGKRERLDHHHPQEQHTEAPTHL